MNLNEFLTGIGFFAKYPYTDFHEMNLDWCITEVAKLRVEFDDFAHVNSLKYAGEWDITKSYSAFSVVDDQGFGYMALKPVAPGTQINDTEFWLMIVDYSQLIADYDARIQALETTVGDASSGLVKDVDDLQSDMTNAQSDIGALQATVGDASSGLVKDVDDLQNDVGALQATVGDASSGLVKDVDDLQTAISQILATGAFCTPEDYGAAGDGVTDDTQAVQDAFDSGRAVFIKNTYLITPNSVAPFHHGIKVNSNTLVFGTGSLLVAGTNYSNYEALYVHGVDNVTITGITIVGDVDTHIGAAGEWGFGINVDDSSNVIIDHVDISKCWGDGVFVAHLDDSTPVIQNKNITVRHSNIHHNRRNNITISCVKNIIIDGCNLSNAAGAAPQSGIDIEPDPGVGETVIGCKIINCDFHHNATRSIAINHLISNDVMNVVIANNTFIDENEAINGYVSGGYTQWSLPLITGNVFRAIAHRVLNASNFGCCFENNYVYIENSDEVLFVISGSSATFKNNNIVAITTNALMFHIAAFGPTIEGNTIYGQSGTYMFSIGGNTQKCSISNNTFPAFTGAMTAFIRTYVSNSTKIYGNKMSAANPPAYFILCDSGYSHSDEMAAFNDITFTGSAVSGGTFSMNANVINGTYTA